MSKVENLKNLKILREGLEKRKQNKRESKRWGFGLCGIAEDEGILGWITEYLSSQTRRKRVFYRFDGIPTSCRTQFVWKVRRYKVRLDWIDERIKVEENKT